MKSEHSTHPTPEVLRDFAAGKLPGSEAAEIEQHLHDCAYCGEILAQTQHHDPLLARLHTMFPEPIYSPAGTPRPDNITPDPMADVPKALREHPRYQILERLGMGGMGVVYKAEHRLLHRQVVMKVIRPDLTHDPEMAERFEREARMAAKLSHRHVVTVHEAERIGKVFFVVMEFVQGQTLAELLRSRGPLPVPVACELMRQAALGLQHLHEQGLVHRDVKPSNLMLTDAGIVKVLDLGLALRLEDHGSKHNLTMPQHSMGTVDYMAPEQWQDSHEVDIRADVYSLGCTFFALLTGAPPFGTNKDTNLPRQIWAHTLAPIPPIIEKRPEVSRKLADVLNKMLAKKQEDRFAVPAAVAEALAPFAGESELAAYLRSGSIRGYNGSIHPDENRPRLAAVATGISRRAWITAAVGAVVLGAAGSVWEFFEKRSRLAISGAIAPMAISGPPIRVGVLHSLTGTMAISEKSVVDATLFAIDELNSRGGLLGRKIEAVVVDGCSDPATFATSAEALITQDKVCAVFGCWTSASRKTVRPIFEKYNHLLFYPVQYEGLEESTNIIYVGAAPNQQILPAVRWCCDYLKKKRMFLIGSDYIFPRCANAIIRDQAATLGGEIVGEEYIPLGSADVAAVIAKIQAAEPDVILNTINGDSNIAFFRALRAAGITSQKIPTISFSITEEELSNLSSGVAAGDYAVWNYFMSIDRPQNQVFVKAFHERYGSHRLLTDPMEAAYIAVHVWSQAVTAAGTDQTMAVRKAVLGQTFDAPEGMVKIDPVTQHTSKTIRIGKITQAGRFEIVFTGEEPIDAVPYPPTRTRQEWDQFVTDLQLGWGGKWAKSPV